MMPCRRAQPSSTASGTTPTGRESDGSGVYYYRARYYHAGQQRLISEDPIGLAGGLNCYTYAGNAPLTFSDPLGLKRCPSGSIRFNPAKGVVALVNAANAGRLYASGALKLATAAGIAGTGVGTPASAGLAVWGLWNLRSAYAVQQRGLQQWSEAFAECSTDAMFRNLLGVFPFGQHFDDPNEPTPQEFFESKVTSSRIRDWLAEIGTLSP
jgi:RHS repeat-associated protein